MNFAGQQKKLDRKAANKVVEFLKNKLLGLGRPLLDTQQAMATEIECNQPDCVPIETLVILLGATTKWSDKIMKPIAEVTYEDVLELEIPVGWDSESSAAEVIELENLKVLVYDSIETFLSNLDSDEARTREISKLQSHLSSLAAQLTPAVVATAPVPAAVQTPAPIKSTLVSMVPNPPAAPTIANSSSSNSASTTGSSGINSVSPPISTSSTSATTASTTTKSTIVSMTPSTPMSTSSSAVAPVKSSTLSSSTPIPAPTLSSSTPTPTLSLSSERPRSAIETISSSGRGFRVSTAIESKSIGATERHNKGTRQRGCPCCDPDNIDNIVDKILSLDA